MRRKARQAEEGVKPDPSRPEKLAQDWPAAPFTGAKWGALVGFAASNLFLLSSTVSAFGLSIYPGDAGLVIVPAVVGGALLGALIGWIAMDPPSP